MHGGRMLACGTAAALAIALLAASCSQNSADSPVASTPPPGPSTAASSAAPTPPPTPSPSPTTVTPSPPPTTTTKRTAAELRAALLGLKDVPAGFAVESDSAGGGGSDKASSTRSECAALVRQLNSDQVPGSRADAQTSFSGGSDGPYVDESLDAMGTPTAARGVVVDFRSAVKKCRKISLTVDGVGTSTLDVREISFADVGNESFAARFSASKGPLAGFELIQAGIQSKDVLVGMTFVGLDPPDAEAATQDAVQKVQDKLTTSQSS